VVIGGQADQVAAVLKDQYSDGMSLSEAFSVAIAALGSPVKREGEAGGGDRAEVAATQLEVALLDRGRAHRAFRRLTGPRLETLLNEAIPGKKKPEPEAIAAADAGDQAGDEPPADPAESTE
jgi:proteasome alpha subunit